MTQYAMTTMVLRFDMFFNHPTRLVDFESPISSTPFCVETEFRSNDFRLLMPDEFVISIVVAKDEEVLERETIVLRLLKPSKPRIEASRAMQLIWCENKNAKIRTDIRFRFRMIYCH